MLFEKIDFVSKQFKAVVLSFRYNTFNNFESDLEILDRFNIIWNQYVKILILITSVSDLKVWVLKVSNLKKFSYTSSSKILTFHTSNGSLL